MATNEIKEPYERPTVTVVGTLREKTESAVQNKGFSTTSDFHYPAGFSFNFS